MAHFARLHQALAAAAEAAKACAAATSHEAIADRQWNETLVAELKQCKDQLASSDSKFEAVFAQLMRRGDFDFPDFAGRFPGQDGNADIPAVSSSSSAGAARGLRRPLSPTASPPAKRQAAAKPDF